MPLIIIDFSSKAEMVVDLLTGTLYYNSSLVKLAARRGPRFVAVAVKILGEVDIRHGSDDLIKDSFSDDYTVSFTIIYIVTCVLYMIYCVYMGTISSNHEQSCTSWIILYILNILCRGGSFLVLAVLVVTL